MCEFWDFLKVEKAPNDKVENLFDEVMADYFAGVIGFGGDWEAFKSLYRPYIYYLSPGEKPEFELRLALSEAIYNYIKNGDINQLTEENPEIKRVLGNSKLPEKARELPLYLRENLESDSTQFKRLLGSLIKKMPSSFNQEHEYLLRMLQGFFVKVADAKRKSFSSPDQDFPDQERRHFFHSFWLETYKRAVSGCFNL